jgi:hypothetical protein
LRIGALTLKDLMSYLVLKTTALGTPLKDVVIIEEFCNFTALFGLY